MPREQGGGRWKRSSQTVRSEEHTSELQSRQYLVCRLLLEKKKKKQKKQQSIRTKHCLYISVILVCLSLLYFYVFFLIICLPPISTLFPYTTLFRSCLETQRSASTPVRKP